MQDALILAERINLCSPYSVSQSSPLSVQFTTMAGALYDVGFTPDYSLGMDGVFQFYIQNMNHTAFARDVNIRDTIWAVLEDFFSVNETAMLYICDVNDGRQYARNRLFNSWFASYSKNKRYQVFSAQASYEGESYFASLIIKKTNPLFEQFANSFFEFESNIKDKLEE